MASNIYTHIYIQNDYNKYFTNNINILISITIISINIHYINQYIIYYWMRTICKFSLQNKIRPNIRMKNYLIFINCFFISSIVLKFSNQYIKNDKNNLRFTYIVLLFVASINLLILWVNFYSYFFRQNEIIRLGIIIH